MLKAKGWVVGLAVVVSAFAAAAMPTKAEFQKVLPIVKEISADDIAAVRAGKMTPVVAGDNAFRRAKDMSLDEASRYLFFESAFAHYVRAEEYDKAAGVVDALRSTIKDVPDASVIELIERRLRKIPRKHAGQLYAMLQDARSRERLGKRLAVYKKAAAANPSDTIPQGRLAASYVLLGDWESAAKAAETPDAAVLADLNWRIARHQAAVAHVFAKSALGEHARRIYVMSKTEGLSPSEIARRLGGKPNAVRAVLSRVERMIAAVEGEYD